MLLDLIFVSVLLQDSLPAAKAVTLLRAPLTDPNAVCNDGSQAVYYHQQVSVSASGFPNQNRRKLNLILCQMILKDLK